jgi:hypothetical protein
MRERSASTIRPARGARARRAAPGALAAAWLALACASPPGERLAPPRFEFSRDTFAWANELYWQYDGDGRARSRAARGGAEPVDYGQRCIVMARAVRQFLFAARFEPDAPPVSAAEYRARVRQVFAADPRMEAPSPAPVTIPGFADLRDFSRAHEELLKESIGGFFPTYFQRGNWRLILPFPPSQQRATARGLRERIARGHAPIVHVVNFPKLDINHALLLFAAEETPLGLRFGAYDPNQPEHPLALVFDEARAAFHLPRTPYFPGGRVKVYEIYRGWFF